MTKKILFDEKICVRCGACVSESEFGGVTFKDGKIFVDNSKREDWTEIISICPTGAMKISDGKFSL
ncbi:MAG: (4Fe-4S)-binding protein [Selenomonadaceae bacterium]|nr:(4Fe-4S)-binding protein [Selenomonadaceae bacterium]